MVDVIELHHADEDQIDGDNVVQQARNEQNEYPGKDGHKRRQMGSGNDHWCSSGGLMGHLRKNAGWDRTPQQTRDRGFGFYAIGAVKATPYSA